MPDHKKPDKFTDLLTRLVRVPKEEIEEQEHEYQESKEKEHPAKPGHIANASQEKHG